MKFAYIAALALISLIFVQSTYAKPPSPEERIERMQTRLGLTDKQAQTAREIFEQAKSNCENTSTRWEFRNCMQGQRDEVRKSIEKILTEEQLDKHKQFVQNRQQKFQNRRFQNGRGQRRRQGRQQGQRGDCNCSCQCPMME